MKLSRYSLIIPLSSKDEYILFNTLSKATVVINKETEEFLKGDLSFKKEDKEKENIICELKDMKIIVDDNADEDVIARHWFNKLKYDTQVFHFTIFTTLDCNLRCVYCYENGVKKKSFMNVEASERVLEWIKSRVEKYRPRILSIQFHGGEPLLNMKAIEILSRGLKMLADNNNVELKMFMITNGVLLTPKNVDLLQQYGLRRIKLTLDGNRQAHNLKRPFKNGKGSFDIIIKNLFYAADKISIDITGNFDDSSINTIPELLDYLKDLGLAEKIGAMRFKPITKTIFQTRPNECSNATLSNDQIEKILWATDEIQKRGFKPYKDISIGPCKAFFENSFVIDPEGNLYKCTGFVGHNEFCVGNIFNGGPNYMQSKFMTDDVWETCLRCPYVPMCTGGCRHSAYIEKHDIASLACEKRYFDRVGIEMLKMGYLS